MTTLAPAGLWKDNGPRAVGGSERGALTWLTLDQYDNAPAGLLQYVMAILDRSSV